MVRVHVFWTPGPRGAEVSAVGAEKSEAFQGSRQRKEAISSCSRGGKKKLQIPESVGSPGSFHVSLTDPVWAGGRAPGSARPCVGGVLRTKVHCCRRAGT